jgi:hypothetical protein
MKPTEPQERQDSKHGRRNPPKRLIPALSSLDSCRAPLRHSLRTIRWLAMTSLQKRRAEQSATELQTPPDSPPSKQERDSEYQETSMIPPYIQPQTLDIRRHHPRADDKSTERIDYPLESCRDNSGVLSRDSRFSTGVLSRKLLIETNNQTNSLRDKTPNC